MAKTSPPILVLYYKAFSTLLIANFFPFPCKALQRNLKLNKKKLIFDPSKAENEVIDSQRNDKDTHKSITLVSPSLISARLVPDLLEGNASLQKGITGNNGTLGKAPRHIASARCKKVTYRHSK